jgi:hypothetical protein
MKFCLKLSTILLILLLFTSSASAWQQSFEGSAADDAISKFTMISCSVAGIDHGFALKGTGTCSVGVAEGFSNYMAFSVYGSGTSPSVEIMMYSISGPRKLDCYNPNIICSAGTWHRVEIIDTGGVGVNVYIDSTFYRSYTYINGVTGSISSQVWSIVCGSGAVYIDDISTDAAAIFCDDTVVKGAGDGQYYRVGCELGSTSGNATFHVKAYSPSGNYIQQDVTNFSEKLIPMSFITEPGTYFIRLYQSDDSGHYLPMATHTFTYDFANSNQIYTDKKQYAPGETISIITYAQNYSGYKVEIPYYDSTGKLQTYKCDVTSSEQTTKFLIPPTALGGSFVIALLDSYGGVRAGTQY